MRTIAGTVDRPMRIPSSSVTSPDVWRRIVGIRPWTAALWPLALTGALAACIAFPIAAQNGRLTVSVLAAAGALATWAAMFAGRATISHRSLALDVVPRRQHYLQMFVQGSLFLYWGWYWPEVYRAAPLLLAQLLFAFAFDALLSWSRRDVYTLGFGPFPVVFSTNLFLWFKPDYFVLQFVMVAVGLAAKELIRWNKDGRRVHIFNPSSFPLALASIALLATSTTHLTWGIEIATTFFYPPHIYLFIFAIALASQYFFGVTTMTLSAVVTTYAFGLVYHSLTGMYFFLDDYIPIAVFLGMNLLFTDPSTAPRGELGRIWFGMLYAAGVIVSYRWLEQAGAPTFYDKLLPIPVLNLLVQAIDRAAASPRWAWLDPARLGRTLAPRRRNLAYMTVWSLVFLGMSSVHAVGDTVPGHWLPYVEQSCRDGRHNACPTLALYLDEYCSAGSGWACNEMGVLFGNPSRIGPAFRIQMFGRACAAAFEMGCENTRLVASRRAPRSADPRLSDLPIILREGKGSLPEMSRADLLSRACTQGWQFACAGPAAQVR